MGVVLEDPLIASDGILESDWNYRPFGFDITFLYCRIAFGMEKMYTQLLRAKSRH